MKQKPQELQVTTLNNALKNKGIQCWSCEWRISLMTKHNFGYFLRLILRVRTYGLKPHKVGQALKKKKTMNYKIDEQQVHKESKAF